MKSVDLFIGVKAEQSLRDAVRNAIEQEDPKSQLELAPFGKKDWIAGSRVNSSIKFSELVETIQSVRKQLLALGSHQRIRQETVRVYAVQPPVPVFKDYLDPDLQETTETAEEEPPEKSDGQTTCPICKRNVHSYNLQHDPRGRVVGCYMCGGDPREF
ncbi:MAG: hypothetical protein GY847_26680 [Proteobacteria bacterium]|nr:hypothetical protein [Pseudomonadota bacterium]